MPKNYMIQIDYSANGDRRSQQHPTFRGVNARVDDENKFAAARLLLLNKSFIGRDVTKYINVNYPHTHLTKQNVKEI